MIVGLDTASTRWHAVQSDGFYLCINSEQSNVDRRRLELYTAARNYFKTLPPGTTIFAEEPLALAKNGKTTRLLGLAAGAIWAAYVDLDLEWHWVDVAHWKKVVVGNGNASKEMIKDHVMESYRVVYPQADYYDAHCLMIYGIKAEAGDL